MTTYLWLKFMHILAAITAVGTNATYLVWLLALRRSNEHAPYVLNVIRALDARLANPSYIVLPVTGILMVLDADLGFTTFWVAAAIVLYVSMAVFAGTFFSPALRRQIALAGRDPVDEVPYERASRRTIITGAVTMTLVAAIIYMMVMKPAP